MPTPAVPTAVPIPKPDGALPGLGHLRLLDPEAPVQSLLELADQMGEIFALEFPGGGEMVCVSSQRLVNELCDEARFDKKVSGALYNIRDIALDGLFTAHTTEPNWQKAHKLLMPAFSQGAMNNYFPVMLDVVLDLLARWRNGPSDGAIDVPDDMVRLTLETIGLCGFDFRFGSFQTEQPHAFVTSMLVALQEALDRAVSIPVLHRINFLRQRRYDGHVDNLKEVVDRVIAERKVRGPQADDRDLLSLMLAGDGSGQRLSDENIRYQIITFLIAGHETTSGLMSFALYLLLKHPAVMRRAVAEADATLGDTDDAQTSLAQVGRLRFIRQVLNEALRLYPPAPAFTLMPKADCLLGGQYALKARKPILVLAGALHRDPLAWGENSELFDPEHFSAQAEANRAANAFKPFGNGQRACIGRQFALQEAALALGLILKNFKLVDVDNYQLEIKETLTLKPEGFRLMARHRTPELTPEVAAQETAASAPEATSAQASAVAGHNTPLHVFYGSNMGSAEQVAMRLADEAAVQGYLVSVAELDAAVDELPTTGVVVIISASYNGQPPDNARAFVQWLEGGPDLSGVSYAVFGLGNRDWSTTYQKVPVQIDSQLQAAGAKRVLPRGEADARGDFYGAVDDYLLGLWPDLAEQLGLQTRAPQRLGPRLTLMPQRLQRSSVAAALAHELRDLNVLRVQELVNQDSAMGKRFGGSKRLVSLALPQGVDYKTGDHLLVMPRNPEQLVERALAHFAHQFPDGVEEIVKVQLNHGDEGALPIAGPVRLGALLAHHFELQEPATRRQIEYLASVAQCPPDAQALTQLANSPDDYRERVMEARLSLLDLLNIYPSCDVSADWFLSELPELHPRYYSIASSHHQSPDVVDIVASILREPHQGHALGAAAEYLGACSSVFAGLVAGDRVSARVRYVDSDFLPPDNLATPIVLIGPGTGVAPFRGFMQDRLWHLKQGAGPSLGPAHLIFGCRHRDVDFLFQEEMLNWQAQGVCELHTAFSRDDSAPYKYVQDVVAAQAELIWDLLNSGGIVYVCGDAQHMLAGVRGALKGIFEERAAPSEVDQAQQWVTDLETQGRLRIDAWA